jgi:hypothetical protein
MILCLLEQNGRKYCQQKQKPNVNHCFVVHRVPSWRERNFAHGKALDAISHHLQSSNDESSIP